MKGEERSRSDNVIGWTFVIFRRTTRNTTPVANKDRTYSRCVCVFVFP